MTPTERIAEITARQQERREQERAARDKAAASKEKRAAFDDARMSKKLCPRAVKRFRNKCETTKRYLTERAAAAEEEASGWDGDPQRWAALTLVSQLLRLQVEQTDDVLHRLNELLLRTEPAGVDPIEAVIELGRELQIEKRLGEGWAERCRQPYEAGAYKRRKRRQKKARQRRLTSSKRG